MPVQGTESTTHPLLWKIESSQVVVLSWYVTGWFYTIFQHKKKITGNEGDVSQMVIGEYMKQ